MGLYIYKYLDQKEFLLLSLPELPFATPIRSPPRYFLNIDPLCSFCIHSHRTLSAILKLNIRSLFFFQNCKFSAFFFIYLVPIDIQQKINEYKHPFRTKMLKASELVEVGFELSSKCFESTSASHYTSLSGKKSTLKYFMKHGKI